jgi:hypothetical protein
MGLITTPAALAFLRDFQLLEYSANSNIATTKNYTGYIKFTENGTKFLCEARPAFSSFTGKFSIDVSDILPLSLQAPPDSALTASGVSSGLLPGGYGTIGIEVGESSGNPITDTITNTLSIKQINGSSTRWTPLSNQAAILLHSLFSTFTITPRIVTRNVLYTSPDFICVYSSGGSVSFTVDQSTAANQGLPVSHTVSLAEGVNYITTSPAQLGLATNCVGYTINILGQKLSYKILQTEPDQYTHIIYPNGLGGIETLLCVGAKKMKVKATKDKYEVTKWAGASQRNGLVVETPARAYQMQTLNTGYITKEHAVHLSQLSTTSCWLIQGSTFIAHTIEDNSLELINTSEDLHSVAFTIAPAFASTHLNNF